METEFISFKKIVIFGSKGVGKTTLIKKMKMKNDIVEGGKQLFLYFILFVL